MNPIRDFERMMSERMPSMKAGIEALPEGEKPWDDFDNPEGDFEKAAKEKTRRADSHRRWKAGQDKDPEVRNYHGADNDAKGRINWGKGR